MSTTDTALEIGGTPHYLARAARPTTAGVVLLPHVHGVDAFVRGFADELAAHGLTTVAWNPYPQLAWGEKTSERPARPTDEQAVALMSGLVDALGTEFGITTVGTIGFCMGGRYAFLFGAHEPRLGAVVACYPSLPAELGPGQSLDPLAAAATIAAPVQVVYPGRDRVTTRPVFDRLQAALEARPVETAIAFYPQAEHGFMAAAGENNAAATRRARPLTIAFLETYLTG